MRGWPKARAPFSLGGWGKVVNLVAIVWGLAMLLNFLTPSGAVSGLDPGDASPASYLRIYTNPKPIQTDYFVEGEQLLDFKIGFLNEIPIIWTVFGVVEHRRARSTTSPSSGGSPTRRWWSPTTNPPGPPGRRRLEGAAEAAPRVRASIAR